MTKHQVRLGAGLLVLLTAAEGLCADPLAVAKLKATAAATNEIAVSWEPPETASSVRVRVLERTRSATVIPGDYSLFPNAWPDGWTYHASWRMTTGEGGGFAAAGGSSSKVWPHFVFPGAWFATALYAEPITALSFTFRSLTSAADTLEAQRLVVEACVEGGVWRSLAEVKPAYGNTTQTVTCDAAENLRQLRFRAESSDPMTPPNFILSEFIVTLGADEEREVWNGTVTGSSAKVTGLSAEGLYFVEVTPIAEPGVAVQTVRSEAVTLAGMKFRSPVPVAFGTVMDSGYREDFSSLAGVSGTTALKDLPSLAAWQFQGAETVAADMRYSKSYASNAVAGEYIVSDAGRTTNSYMLATRATGSSGAMFGVALTNDTVFTISGLRLSFDAVQLNATANAKSQVVEWRLAATADDLSVGADWQTVDLGDELTAPATTKNGLSVPRTHRFESLPLTGAKIVPGQVLLLRWRDEKRASSPWMGVDNVSLDFTSRREDGFRLILR